MKSLTAPQLLEKLQARTDNHVETAKPISAEPILSETTASPQVTDVPYRLKALEPEDPTQVTLDDPVFMTSDAARILGVAVSRLEKWRQRNQGPDYLCYDGGFFRYELSALIEFKASRRVRPSRQPHPGRRR